MEHCSLTVKKRFSERLKRNGIEVDTDKLLKSLDIHVKGGKHETSDKNAD